MKRKQLRHQLQGVVAIEAAIVLPLLILVTLAGLQYGWLFLKKQEITNVARHAVRYATLSDVSFAQARQLIVDRMTELGLNTVMIDADTKVGWVNIAETDVGDALYAQVAINAQQADIINFLPVPAKLTAHATMSKEGNP